jgi:lipopolysaccharide heptosyltransferase II
LIIRADNLGDLVMSTPAIRALKETTGAHITVLTSQMATGIAKHISEIDEVITYDLPWVKTNNSINSNSFYEVVSQLREERFDAAVIFTVFSQNPLPAAMLAYLANIPKRLAYCRENPYDLLTDWVPDKEPYEFIKHQVERDLDLVRTIGATTADDRLALEVSESAWQEAQRKLVSENIDLGKQWIIFHAGVSEVKRQYSEEGWIEAGKKMVEQGYQILFTGTKNEKALTDSLVAGIGSNAFSIAGFFSLEEFIAAIKHAPLIVSVNTGTVHIAAAVGTPVVVLYATTNPQHSPWKVPSRVLEFDVPIEMRSKNEVLQFLYKEVYSKPIGMPTAEDIVKACFELLGKQHSTVETATETLTPVTD